MFGMALGFGIEVCHSTPRMPSGELLHQVVAVFLTGVMKRVWVVGVVGVLAAYPGRA